MSQNNELSYPAGLYQWAGHRAGGVRRPFHDTSGRPSGQVIETPLLNRLRNWAEAVARDEADVPRVVLLVGGPGNGKTEAIESTIHAIDRACGLDGRLVNEFSGLFNPQSPLPVPRLAQINVSRFKLPIGIQTLAIVQDASVSDPTRPGQSAASLLIDDLVSVSKGHMHDIYLACVNRGVLDDALITAIDNKTFEIQSILEDIIKAVGLSPTAPQCWPLTTHSTIAVWPMDVESLIAEGDGVSSAFEKLLYAATDTQRWPQPAGCPAGENCPFCISRGLLSTDPHRSSLIRILRWYELASGKRWSFRDLFSLVSFLLAGVPHTGGEAAESPCEWAANLISLEARTSSRPESLKLVAPFALVSAQYQHALFGRWPRISGRGLRGDLRELRLDGDATLLGLHYFLSSSRGRSVPATLEPQLLSLCDTLDPALADPDDEVEVSSRSLVKLRDLDSRFSHSVDEGFQYIRRYRCLTKLEVNLLTRLVKADERLSEAEVRRRKPVVASRVQRLVRDFACRLVRRTLGVRSAVTRDRLTLTAYQRVIDGDQQLLHEAVKQVSALLNERERFRISLNTTFGEPLPPAPQRAILTTERQRVSPKQPVTNGRPTTPLRFLTVGSGTSTQSIPLTYELFRSVRELRSGMLAASLPRPVVALLDTTRARLAGQIVRDEEMLEGAEIRIGLRGEVIVRELGEFLIRQEEHS